MGFLKPHYQAPPPSVVAPPSAPAAPPTLQTPSVSTPMGNNNPIGQNNGSSGTVKTSPQGAPSINPSQLNKPQLNNPVGSGKSGSVKKEGATEGDNSAAGGLPSFTIMTPPDLEKPATLTIKSLLGGQ